MSWVSFAVFAVGCAIGGAGAIVCLALTLAKRDADLAAERMRSDGT